MSYDVYYATGGGSLVYGGSDVWVNNWLREVAPKLDYPSKLLIHRRNPDKRVKFDSPIEVIWEGDHPKDFETIASKSRRIHILHGYYTCFNAILPNHPTLSLSDRVQKTVLYISVSFAVSYTGLLLPSF